jgi:hypothetical protein
MRKTICANGIIGVSLTLLPFALQMSEHRDQMHRVCLRRWRSNWKLSRRSEASGFCNLSSVLDRHVQSPYTHKR